MPSSLSLEIATHKGWQDVATVTLLGSEQDGELAATRLEYDLDYAVQRLNSTPMEALSLQYPVSLTSVVLPTWPAFLLDLLPQGHAMKFVEKYYKIPDLRKNYWHILSSCPLSPPGNIRVKVQNPPDIFPKPKEFHAGFSLQDVTGKGELFLEHMLASGAPVSGTTGASGAAPKFLLREDFQGRFFADGALEDKKTKALWFVKFPRGKHQSDFEIIEAESKVALAAASCGLDVSEACSLKNHALFLKRFDRILKSDSSVSCLGLESFYSAIGSTIFGEFRYHEEFLGLIARYSTKPEMDLAEYLARDLLSCMIGNTDNHGRNSSFLKTGNEVRLAPLYDMAPMAWDTEGIVRSTRWKDENENWVPEVSRLLASYKLNSDQFAQAYLDKCKSLENFWTELDKAGGCEIFLKHGTTKESMINLAASATSRAELFRRGK
ncbi:MAG: type II toxin-antitoxin system HipA family toxin [Proteobacteria bacterium]|nr:type II toxin-antitoxin system HipA family toxin [Pseudomonadota bacterium]